MRLVAWLSALLLLATTLAAQVPIPEGMRYVASSRGRVYYPVGCDAWHDLAPAYLRWFRTEAEAKAARLTRTTNKDCAASEPTGPR